MSYQGTIEVGKLYRSRRNEQVRIYATDGLGRYSIHGATKDPGNGWAVLAWSPQGLAGNGLSGDTIVGEWKEPDPLTYRHYSHEELKTFIGKVVICKVTGLPELIVGMVNECTVRLSVKEATSFDLLVMYEWEGKLPCGVLVTTGSCVGAAVGDVVVDYDWGIMGRPLAKPD